MSTRLPAFIHKLKEPGLKDANELHQDFLQYSELLRFENGKMSISSESKKLVEEYAKAPTRLKEIINDSIQTITNTLKLQLLTYPEKTQPTIISPSFSLTLKS